MHKTKNTQKRLKNGLFALGGVVFLGAVIYALGVLNDVSSAPGSFGLKVENTVPNRVEYLESLEIKSAEARQSPAVTLSHEGHYLKIDGPVNIDSLAVGDERNSAGEASAVFGGTNNQAQGTASAIVGGSDNSLNHVSSNSVLAATAGVNVDRGQQIFIGAANNSSATQSQNVMIVGGENSNVANTQNALIAGDGHTVTASSAVVFGKNVNVQDKDNIFVYSNKGGVFSPAQGNAFYINAQSGVALNHTEAAVQLDINGGLVLQNKEQSSLPTLDSAAKGTMTVVTKNGKIGLCGRDGKQWMPLSESAKAGLCVANGTLPQKPINDGSNDLQSARTHGAASNRSTVTINNSITSLPKVWDDVHGVWKDQVWTYHTDLGAGQYICGVGYHTNMDKPNGVFTQNCMACTYIDNMYSWTSDGKGVNNCGFTCKAGFKYSASARSCTACEPGTYIAQNGHTQTQCTLCDRSTHKKPDHSYYTTENSCAWKCDDGYAQVGNTCQKAEWKKEEGNPECKQNGLLNEGEKTIRRVCKTSRGVVVDDESICNHWSRTKPNPISRTERVYKQGCNDTWNCPAPDCSARGECGGKKKNVECTALAINQNGTEYTARKQELVSCDRPCENAQCGSQHSSYFDGVLTERSSNLCLLPSVLISRSLGSTSTGRWTWQCQGKDTDASCHAQQRAPGAPSCPSEASLTSPSCDNGSTVINHRQDTASHTWQCQKTEGRLTKTSGSCLLCKSGYHREANVCVSNSKELDCVKTGKPEHAKYIDAKVTVTWNKQSKTWAAPANCAWECNTGYTKDGNACKLNATPVDGKCGFGRFSLVQKMPDIHERCSSGIMKNFSEMLSRTTGELQGWSWSCEGENGGISSICLVGYKAPGEKIDGRCGLANAQPRMTAPASYVDLCSSGKASSVSSFRDSSSSLAGWSWSCRGENGGETAECSAPYEAPIFLAQCGTSHEAIVASSDAITARCAEGIGSEPRLNASKTRWEWTCSSDGAPSVSCHAYQKALCKKELTKNNGSESHTFYYDNLDTHQYSKGIYSTYYYRSKKSNTSYATALCDYGNVKTEEMNRVFDSLKTANSERIGAKRINYTCYGEGPNNADSCSMTAGSASESDQFVILQQNKEDQADIGFLVERCPQGYHYVSLGTNNGHCAKSKCIGTPPYNAKRIDLNSVLTQNTPISVFDGAYGLSINPIESAPEGKCIWQCPAGSIAKQKNTANGIVYNCEPRSLCLPNYSVPFRGVHDYQCVSSRSGGRYDYGCNPPRDDHGIYSCPDPHCRLEYIPLNTPPKLCDAITDANECTESCSWKTLPNNGYCVGQYTKFEKMTPYVGRYVKYNCTIMFNTQEKCNQQEGCRRQS